MNIDSLDPNVFAPVSLEAWLQAEEPGAEARRFAALVLRTDDGIAVRATLCPPP